MNKNFIYSVRLSGSILVAWVWKINPKGNGTVRIVLQSRRAGKADDSESKKLVCFV